MKAFGMQYEGFWNAIPNCAQDPKIYNDYSVVNEKKLYFRLASYNKYHNYDFTEVDSEIESIKEFLQKETDDDGTLRIYNPPENIEKYLTWYNTEGENIIDMKYERDFRNYCKSLAQKNTQISANPYDLTLEQLKTLVKDFMEQE